MQDPNNIISIGYLQPNPFSFAYHESLIARYNLTPVLRPSSTNIPLENEGIGSFQLHPNPSVQRMQVDLELKQPAHLLEARLCDLQGRTVHTFALSATEATAVHRFHLHMPAALPVGAYVLSIITPEGTVSKEVLKSNE